MPFVEFLLQYQKAIIKYLGITVFTGFRKSRNLELDATNISALEDAPHTGLTLIENKGEPNRNK